MNKSSLASAALTLAAFISTANESPARADRTTSNQLVEVADPYVHRDGAQEAKRLLQQNRLVVVTFGLPAPWSPDYRRILRDQYAIEYRMIAGCVVSDGLLQYAREFNAVMHLEIESRFGSNIFDRVAQAAQAQSRQRNATESSDKEKEAPSPQTG